MHNLIKYKRIFEQCFNVSSFDNIDLKYQSLPEWDSVGHNNIIIDGTEIAGELVYKDPNVLMGYAESIQD